METPASEYQKRSKTLSLINQVLSGKRMSVTVFVDGETDDVTNYNIGRILHERTNICKNFHRVGPDEQNILIERIDFFNQQLINLLGL